MQAEPASMNQHRRDTASAGYSDLWRSQRKPLSILAACGALLAASTSESVLSFLNQFASVYSFCFIVMLFVLVLPARLFLLSIPVALGTLEGLRRLNEFKIAGVSLPITFTDIKTVIADPLVVLNAAGIRDDFYRIAYITTGLLVCALVVSALQFWRNSYPYHSTLPRPPGQRRLSCLTWNVIALLALLIAAQYCLARYGRFVHANLNTKEPALWRELWLPSSQVTLSRALGVLEYVAFSFTANGGGDIAVEPGLVPTVKELRTAAAKFVNNFRYKPTARLPNIVFFHAESTFDPAAAFKLSAPFELPLWSKQSQTRALSPLRVNVIGGGSWVTEFEVITGVDSRIFGYQGFYTHFYIAPKVKNSFVEYLTRKGYKTAAFYPVEGSFYNAEKAFKAYGFREFFDGRALGLPADWGSLIDRDIIKAVIEHGAFKRSAPFFYFISTSENHGPHPCRSFASHQQFLTTFAAEMSFEKNCQFNEYLKRAISTSAAFELVLKELREIERSTGRPFVLLVYGDHQPWSFTEGIYSVAGGTAADQGFDNFSNVRTHADGYQTFFHLLASDSRIVRSRFTNPAPASLLPTLVSAFVASSYEDLYLPINFLAFASCGSDSYAIACERSAEIARSARNALLTEPSLALPSVTTRPIRHTHPMDPSDETDVYRVRTSPMAAPSVDDQAH
jgi:phosphoglycerol transferase MdoB-like AlkP superfamily enzyme